MSLKVNIDSNFHALDSMMDDLGNKDLAAAAKTSINKALIGGRKVMINQIRQDFNLKSMALKKRILVKKTSSNSLHSMKGEMIFSGIPISMLEFVVGRKENIKQKGIQVRKRRKLKARVAPGKTFHVKGAFIQNVKSKAVFRGKGNDRRLRKLSQASVAVIAFRNPRKKRLEAALIERFDNEFTKQIMWRYNKSADKFSRAPMKTSRA